MASRKRTEHARNSYDPGGEIARALNAPLPPEREETADHPAGGGEVATHGRLATGTAIREGAEKHGLGTSRRGRRRPNARAATILLRLAARKGWFAASDTWAEMERARRP